MLGREEMIEPNIWIPSEVINYIFQSTLVLDRMESRIKELEEEIKRLKNDWREESKINVEALKQRDELIKELRKNKSWENYEGSDTGWI